MAPDRRALINNDWEREPPRDRRDGPELDRTAGRCKSGAGRQTADAFGGPIRLFLKRFPVHSAGNRP